MEKHYSIGELAQLWSLSEKTIRRMFEHEPGVLCWESPETRFQRGYKTLRIPETGSFVSIVIAGSQAKRLSNDAPSRRYRGVRLTPST
jgi:hypothetical protein